MTKWYLDVFLFEDDTWPEKFENCSTRLLDIMLAAFDAVFPELEKHLLPVTDDGKENKPLSCLRSNSHRQRA